MGDGVKAPSFPAKDEDSRIAARKYDPYPFSPCHLATDLGLRRGNRRPINDFVDVEEVLGILTPGLSMADVERRDQLVIARPIKGRARHQRDLGRQMEPAERSGELDRVKRIFLVGDESIAPGGRIAEPGSRGRDLARPLPDRRHEVSDMRDIRLLPIPFEHPDPDARLRRQSLEVLEFLKRAGKMELLVEPELDRLFQGVCRVVTAVKNRIASGFAA
jgi:hypothetical protein